MMSEGEGNFGCTGVLDWAHGTSLGSNVMDDLREEAEKHNVQERTDKAIDQAGEKASGIGEALKKKARKGKGKK